jgi:ATP-dependent Lhr-like helicase
MTELENLGTEIQDFLGTVGITSFTPIQERAIPVIRSGGQNVLLLAPTGSGKTEAALLPLLDRLHEMKRARSLFGFYIVYVTPLRALNRDVFKRIEDLCQHLEVSVAVRHGDTTQYARRKQAIDPPNLLITTPESLQAILPGKRLRYHLKTVFAVVVDEIHELADSKRGVQLSLGMERLERLAGHPIERIGLSATVGNPEEVARLLGGRRKPKTIWAGYGQREMDLRVEMPEPEENLHPLATKLAYPLHSTARLQTIVNLVSNHRSTIVFTNTRSFAEVLGAKMHLLKPPFEFDVHHGSLSKDARIKAEDRLKTGRSRGIVATSSLELGIDIGQADLVIRYSSPREVARFLQRAGRSGHGVGGKAEGIILSTVNLDDVTESGVIVRRARANKVENARIPKKSWDVLGHQIAGLLLDEDEIAREDLLELAKGSHPYAEMETEELDRLLDFMESRRLLRQEDGLVKKHSRTRVFYYERLSTIPDIRQVQAVDMTTRTSIGVLDEDYVTANVEAGSVFVIRGRPWTVISVDEESGEVMCAPATSPNTDVPRWIGEMIPVPYEVASEVADVWASISQSMKTAAKRLGKEYGLDKPAQKHVIVTVEQVRNELGSIPTTSRFIIEDLGEGLVLHAPLGTRANETLGIVIAALLTTRLGFDVGVERDPYRILFTSTERINPSAVTDVLEEYTEEQASHILKLAVKNTQNFASRFIHVARRMDIVKRDAKPRQIPVKRLIKSYEDSPLFDEAMREVLEEKMDEPRMRSVFREYSNGKMEIHTIKTSTPSALARLIIEEKTRFEVMGEISEEEEVLRMMQERLLSRRFRLVCMAGNHWNSIRTVSTLEDQVACPICGSKMIAAVSPSDESLKQVLAKQMRGEELSKREKKEREQASLTAQLVALYGKTALMVLAGRGIGPRTASRILKPGHTDRLEILRAIAKGEMEYERTRPYW